MNNNFGKGFIDTFSNAMSKDKAVPAPSKLSDKTGVNKKKTTQLQQNIINVIQNPIGQQQ